MLLQSAFLEKGVLTPEEFVKAGDSLVHNCPSWQWAAGDPSKSQSILPKDKQVILVTMACSSSSSSSWGMGEWKRESMAQPTFLLSYSPTSASILLSIIISFY